MTRWNFLTNHARVLLCIARDPGVRLREVAAALGITERSAHAIIADLTAAGYVVKQRHGRRNRYQIQAHLPLPDPASPEPAIGDLLALLMGGREVASGRLLGTPVQRLATIAHGDGTCATHVTAPSLAHTRNTTAGTAAGTTTTESGGIPA